MHASNVVNQRHEFSLTHFSSTKACGVQWFTHWHTSACSHTHAHTHTHKDAHTHTHTHTHTHSLSLSPSLSTISLSYRCIIVDGSDGIRNNSSRQSRAINGKVVGNILEDGREVVAIHRDGNDTLVVSILRVLAIVLGSQRQLQKYNHLCWGLRKQAILRG